LIGDDRGVNQHNTSTAREKSINLGQALGRPIVVPEVKHDRRR
jgi:hypothetical protein